jgi:hypothetical protein
MKEKINRPIVSRGSPVVPVCAALTLLWFGIYGIPVVMDEIKAGWAYSLGVIFNNATKIYRSSSPMAFWMNIGLLMFGFVMAIALGIFILCGVVIDHKRKAAAVAKEKERQDLK